ncbi:MAG TPA: beta-galactosidase, partial [Bacteroidota bacterium]|nr:beta-galactosidase [Bacteroidota bacterium]
MRLCPQTSEPADHPFTIDATRIPQPPQMGYLEMGSTDAGRCPDGSILSVNSRYLVLDGKPWLPVMGEFHFSRYPQKYWEEEILKMKAGGVDIISTYIFWIHHEEIEGEFDWSGRRDLRAFVKLCAKHGMYVVARIGPWAHGEARNGGFPDWLLTKGPTRLNDSTFLFNVRRFYSEIGKQLTGLLWKHGGPIIGVQIENEYSNRSPNGGEAYLLKLKALAIEAGLDVPLYTITGWDNAVIPPRAFVPVYGGYPDEAWSGSTHELPPDPQGVFQFHVTTPVGTAGIMQGPVSPSPDSEASHYPRFTAELGGGMEDTYHRRVVISPDDVASMALSALGSGVNLLGYYMFHGGTNPDGALTTLQESQETDYPNDVPVKSYDFQAPIGEFGQMNGAFRDLKVIHQFIRDFGSDLA